jgi:glycosyltransferase involved in cell wall biosynthesis
MKILFCGEASFLKSGYAIYGNNLISRIHATSGFEVAEFANYGNSKDVRATKVPWKLYCNMPETDEESRIYNSNPINHFGAWKFEKVCIDFKPDVVVSYLDSWMMRHQLTSPLRPYYKLVWMPAVDAESQNIQWLDMYSQLDGVFGYTDWAINVLKRESNHKIKTVTATPYCSEKEYAPVLNRNAHKEQFGMQNMKIVGFVSRNQKRKLFPDLFMSFRKYLDRYKQLDTFLYCHTTYPDGGWNIPQLLKDYSLTNRVFFTYICRGCGDISPSLFHDAGVLCHKCNAIKVIANVDISVPATEMAKIFNLFDIYVHYANSEAWGMAQIEAAACGVPVMSVDYAGMHDIVSKLGGIKLNPIAASKEVETGCFRAIPDNEDFIEKLNEFLSLPEPVRLAMGRKTRHMFDKNYSWDAITDKWISFIKDLEINTKQWNSPPDISIIPDSIPENISNADYVRWLMIDVLKEKDKVGSILEANLLRNLTFGMDMEAYPLRGFSREDAFEIIKNIVLNKNYWEQVRYETVSTTNI